MVVLVMFRMMSVVVVASAAIPSLCLLQRGPGRHVAADRGWRLLYKERSKKSVKLFRPNLNLLVILLCMQRRTREQSERMRPWVCHHNHKDNKTLDGNGGQDGELEIMMLLLIEIEDGKPTERSARSRSSADTEYFLVSYRFPFYMRL